MVILPLYQVVFAVQEQKFSKTRFFALMHDGQIREMGMPDLEYPQYSASSGKVCGIFRDDKKDFIALSELKVTESPLPELLFTLSKRRIAFPAMSPDGQKIAFIEYDKNGGDPVMRVILREEFGWFPLQIRTDAALSPLCWGGKDVLIYTDRDGDLRLMSAEARKRGTATIDTGGRLPAFHKETGRLAFVQGGRVVLKGASSLSFEADNVSALNFSNDGNSLYFSTGVNDNYTLCRYSVEDKKAVRLCESDARIVWASEI